MNPKTISIFALFFTIVVTATLLFMTAYHNIDIILNGCIFGEEHGKTCRNMSDTNGIMIFNYPVGYNLAVKLLFLSFFGLAFSNLFLLSSLAKQVG